MERKKESHIGKNLRRLQILVPSLSSGFGRGWTYLGKGMPHKTSFRTTQLQISNDCGVKTAINKSNLPILKRLAIYRLTLNPECFREPHWQAIDARVTMPWQSRAELRIKLFFFLLNQRLLR